MEFKDLIYKRRSVRKYTGGKISDEQLGYILDAGLRAPNACNYQSWHFYVIKTKEKIEELYPEIYAREWIRDCAAVIVVTENIKKLADRFGKSHAYTLAVEDSGAAAENMLLAAADIGFGGCFIGAFDPGKCASHISAADGDVPVLMLSIGTYDEEPSLRDRKPFEESVSFI